MDKQPKPYKVEPEQPKRKFKVLANGDVEMTETQKSRVYFHANDFSTYMHGYEQTIDEYKYHLTDEYKKQITEDMKNLEEDLKDIRKVQKEADEKTKKAYEEEMTKRIKTSFETELAKKEPNMNLLYALEVNNQKRFPEIFKSLDKTKQSKYLVRKAKLNLKK